MAITMAVTGFYGAFAMKETRSVNVDQAAQHWQNIKSTFCTSLCFLRKSKDLHFVLVVDSLVVFAVQPFNMYWQPFFKQIFPATWLFGVFNSALSFTVMLGAYMVLRFGRGRNVKKSLLRLVMMTGLSMLACSLITSATLVIIPFLLHDFLRGWYYPIRSAYIQDQLPDAERATIASMIAMLIALSGTLGLFFSGLVAEHFGIQVSWFVSGLCFIFVALYSVRKIKN
jgi:MFS family permease